MLATLTIWLTVAVAGLALAEIFLSKAHKAWLSNKVTEAWNVLDDIKAWSFYDWFINTQRVTGWLAWAAGFVFGAIVAYRYLDLVFGGTAPAGFGDNVYDVLVGPALAFVGWGIFARTTLLSGQVDRKVIVVAIYTLVGLSIAELAVFAYSHLIRHDTVTVWTYYMLASPIIILVLFAVSGGAVGITMLGLLYVARVILYAGEFVVRRIAEYPKGPVLGLSALIGGIAAVFKAFVGA